MMMEFMNSHSKNLGPYWPQPGRRILENLLADIPFPFDLEGTTEAESSKWNKSSATRIAHKLESDGIPDLAWTRGKAKEETFRMEVSIPRLKYPLGCLTKRSLISLSSPFAASNYF